MSRAPGYVLYAVGALACLAALIFSPLVKIAIILGVVGFGAMALVEYKNRS